MDNHYEAIRGSSARSELNNLGYPINGNDMVDTVIQSMIVSMAKQIKDLQDQIEIMKG